ncbi:hypothetical protein F5Y19DRAFT_371898 [Xylariaceae sp. FL1651]|nr:hypothetical protein F5Y19DRAFT_371898 [Xylariaceae sp. FL1651]
MGTVHSLLRTKFVVQHTTSILLGRLHFVTRHLRLNPDLTLKHVIATSLGLSTNDYHVKRSGASRQPRCTVSPLLLSFYLGLNRLSTVIAKSTSLNVTTIAGVGGRSVLQCW